MDRSQVPLGFGTELAMHSAAMKTYSSMTETERQAVLERARHVSSKQEMESVINDLFVGG